MTIIRQQIKELIDSYQKDFLEKTGIKLVCIPESAGLVRVNFMQLARIIEEFTGGYSVKIKSRKAEYVDARRLFVVIAYEMGYSKESIMKYLNLDRTTFYNIFEKHEDIVSENLQEASRLHRLRNEIIKFTNT